MIDGCATCTDYQTCKECVADKELTNNQCKDKSSTPTGLIIAEAIAGVIVLGGIIKLILQAYKSIKKRRK